MTNPPACSAVFRFHSGRAGRHHAGGLGLNRVFCTTPNGWSDRTSMSPYCGSGDDPYSAIYLLPPVLTNGAQLYSQKLADFHFWAHLLGGIGMGAFMGMAGLHGMLRRTLYANGEFNVYMILAALSGLLLLLAFLAFFINIVMTVGVKGVIGIFMPAKIKTQELVPADK